MSNEAKTRSNAEKLMRFMAAQGMSVEEGQAACLRVVTVILLDDAERAGGPDTEYDA